MAASTSFVARGGLRALGVRGPAPLKLKLVRNFSLPRREGGHVGSERRLSTHVSVIGLHWKTDETRLRKAFEGFGKLEKAELVTPEHSTTHLWGALVYSTFDEAFEAVSEMNGQELDGRLLRVSIVDPPTEGDDPAAPTAASG